MNDRIILHVDINSCYASIEILHRPELRDKPVVVGGDETLRHGIVLAKNDIAKAYNIQTGNTIFDAKRKCTELVVVPPNYALYLRFSKLARNIYEQYSDNVEPFGLDECWLDVTGSTKLFGCGEDIAEQIRKRIKEELGITVSIGVSYNKIFAKLGSDYKKPDAITVFTKNNYKEKIWPLPVEDLLYVGRATAARLKSSFYIRTIGELAQTSPDVLETSFGKYGLMLHSFANGEDTSPVSHCNAMPVIKSFGNSTTTPRDLLNTNDVSIIFYVLADSISERLREAGFKSRTIQIFLRTNDLYGLERQITLPMATNITTELHDAAMLLLNKHYDFYKPLRSVGLRAGNLIPANAPQQLSLYAKDTAKQIKAEQLDKAVSDIRRRFGPFAVERACITSDKSLGHISPKDDHTIHPVSFFNAGGSIVP